MNRFWDIFIYPIIEAIKADYIVEIGVSSSLNTKNILEYCTENNARMTSVDPLPNIDIDEFKAEYEDKFEIFKDEYLHRLPMLDGYDLVLINEDHNGETVYKELKIIEKKFSNKKFPFIIFYDLGVSNSENDSLQTELENDTDLNYQFHGDNQEESLLTAVENFIDETDTELSFEISDINDRGILYPKDQELDKIVKNCLDLYNDLENEQSVLKDNLKKYKSEVEFLENRLEENKNEVEFTSNKYRSLPKRMISRFPMLYMLLKMPKTGIKTTLINRKGYYTIKDNNLLNIGYYLKNNPDVKFTGRDPIIHYMYHGFKEGRKPNPTFNGDYYLETHKDVKDSKLNPLVHYGLFGINEKRKPDTEEIFEYDETESKILGAINFKGISTIIIGFLAVKGDYSPREALIKIDDEKFTILCDEFRSELIEKGINNGNHSFTLKVPPQFFDNKKHVLRLIDNETGKLIITERVNFFQKRSFRDLSGFLSNSLVSPIVYAPFNERDKRCFATMEDITMFLTKLQESLQDLPLVSVILPVYNSIDTIQKSVESVLNQTYGNIELIIVDGGSDDGSFEFINEIKDENINIIRNPSCKKFYQARNLGLTAVNGKYVAYLDSDSTWDSRYIAAMVGAFSYLPDADAIYSGQLLSTEGMEHPFAVRFGTLNRSLLENRNYINLNALCHTHNIYKSIGGFDESLDQLADWDWLLRIVNDAQLYSIPVLLSNYKCKDMEDNDSKSHYLDIFREKQAKRQKDLEVSATKSSKPLINNVSIIIPSYESLDDIHECLDSIFKLNASERIEVIVVDNASSKPVIDYLSKIAAEDKIKFIKNDTNYGFTFAVNQGIKCAKPENDIILMNNDAMITPRAIESMQRYAYDLPDCGIVVPQQVLYENSESISTHVPFADPNYECDVNLSAVHGNIVNVPVFHSGWVVELSFAPFFCVYIKRDVLNSSMGLDAEYGRHYRSDRIFCNYLRHIMNLKIYQIAQAKVYHKEQKSTEILRESSQKDFNIMYSKNQWDEEHAEEFGYKKPPWDF